MCLVSCPPFSHAVAILMLVLPNDWVEGSRCSPPISNDDTAPVCPQDLCCLYSRICCTRAFHSYRISCHGLDQQTPDGGPTDDRTSLRNSTSRMWRSCCRILRCPAAKQTIGVTVASNNFTFEFVETFLSKNIHLFEWKARAAACKWYVMSASTWHNSGHYKWGATSPGVCDHSWIDSKGFATWCWAEMVG